MFRRNIIVAVGSAAQFPQSLLDLSGGSRGLHLCQGEALLQGGHVPGDPTGAQLPLLALAARHLSLRTAVITGRH